MNYRNLSTALDFYQSRGYAYIHDAPWYVGAEAVSVTKPVGAPDILLEVTDKVMSDISGVAGPFAVASGEQSFIQLMLDGEDIKKACCVTPCLRADKFDDWHKFNFMKVELINADDPTPANLMVMVHDALSFFESCSLKVRVTQKPDGMFDIQEKASRKELGSYGIRVYKKFTWIYGTGCAEPRMSSVQRMAKLKTD